MPDKKDKKKDPILQDEGERTFDPRDVKGKEAHEDILDVAIRHTQDENDPVTAELKAEAAVTGTSDLARGPGRPRVFITGGSSGIGRGIALIMAEAGYDVAISYRSKKKEADEVRKYIQRSFDRRCFVYELDTSDEKQIEKVFDQVVSDLGGLEVLVNNAGITIMEEAFEDKLESLDQLIAVNFRGPMILLQKAGKFMKDQGHGGSIINISSIHADSLTAEDAIYGASKAALERASRSYALQYGPYDIRVNTIAPGAILIPRTEVEGHKIEVMRDTVPLGRSGLPRDIAHAVLFLASERSSYITGISILIDGGMALGQVE